MDQRLELVSDLTSKARSISTQSFPFISWGRDTSATTAERTGMPQLRAPVA